MTRNIFGRTYNPKPRRSVFDLTYSKLTSLLTGQVFPCMADEVVPGDTFVIGASDVVRALPLATPVMHDFDITTHYFFVPYRLIYPDWERFITGGIDGKYNDTGSNPLPRWPRSGLGIANGTPYTLWDCFGFPTDIFNRMLTADPSIMPLDFPLRAYELVYWNYYADETLSPADFYDPISSQIDWTVYFSTARGAQAMRYVSWRKDYFTSALPWQQRGTQPAFPISGQATIHLPAATTPYGNDLYPIVMEEPSVGFVPATVNVAAGSSDGPVGDGTIIPSGTGRQLGIPTDTAGTVVGAFADLSSITTFNVADLRLAVQIQKWMERNARSGVRYVEFLRAHFGVHPRDDRLQRPEYIGGSTTRLKIAEVLQTSNSVSNYPQGTMTGHGISVGGNRIGTYHATEFGLIMGMLFIRPKAVYQDGINRQWLRWSRYDFYFPEFSHLSEQGIYNMEIRYNALSASRNNLKVPAADNGIFGFQGRWDEYRYKPSMVCNIMRTNPSGNLSTWHVARHWNPANEDGASATVSLNNAFLTNYSDCARIFALGGNYPQWIVHHTNHLRAIRPLPMSSDPGLLDHF